MKVSNLLAMLYPWWAGRDLNPRTSPLSDNRLLASLVETSILHPGSKIEKVLRTLDAEPCGSDIVVPKRIRHLDFSTLVIVNKEVVSLTGERHEHTEEDDKRLRSIVKEVRATANDEQFEEAIVQKVSLLMHKLATGQHFHEGNKRTALVAGAAFLKVNGYTIGIRDAELVGLMDKAGISGATLIEVREVIRRLVRRVPE